jgi:hypothetical protein
VSLQLTVHQPKISDFSHSLVRRDDIEFVDALPQTQSAGADDPPRRFVFISRKDYAAL